MAQKNTGKTGGKSPAKKNTPKTGSKQAKTSGSKSLDSVRGGSQRGSSQRGNSRGQDAARKAAARESASMSKMELAPAAKAPAGTSGAKNKSIAKRKLTASEKKMWRRMLLVAGIVIVCVFVVMQTMTCVNAQVSSRQTVMVTLSDNIETTGIAIRNESIITSERQGVIVSTIDNGGKVSKGETVANVFNSTDAARAHLRMAEIEQALEQFRSMATAGEDNATEVPVLEKTIRGELREFSKLIYSGDASGATEVSEDVLYLLNKIQVATRVVEDFSDKTAQMENELKNLQAQYPDEPGKLNSPLSGYYISSADGYENLLSTDICASLTPEKLDEILKLRSEPDSSTLVGKIADDYIWYMACEVSAEDAARLAQEDGEFVKKDYTLYLAYSELDSITAKLVGVNTGADSSRKVLIFECSYMVSELSTVRIQPVTIELSSYSGLEIDEACITTREATVSSSDISSWDMEGREALARELCPMLFAHENVSGADVQPAEVDENNPYSVAAFNLLDSSKTKLDEILDDLILPDEVTYTQKGVFIVWGNEIVFKRIKPIYQTGDKVLCAYNLGSGCLKMYDQVVENPEEVYDGQIVNYGG